VTLCDAMQTNSACCIQINDTRYNPPQTRWVSCGTTPKQEQLGTARAGIVLDGGPRCGYTFITAFGYYYPVKASIGCASLQSRCCYLHLYPPP
jgi:hypothetical protein